MAAFQYQLLVINRYSSVISTHTIQIGNHLSVHIARENVNSVVQKVGHKVLASDIAFGQNLIEVSFDWIRRAMMYVRVCGIDWSAERMNDPPKHRIVARSNAILLESGACALRTLHVVEQMELMWTDAAKQSLNRNHHVDSGNDNFLESYL
eukprot:422949_1